MATRENSSAPEGPFRLTVFSTASAEGRELACGIKASREIAEMGFAVTCHELGGTGVFNQAILNDHAVVLDATLEVDGQHNLTRCAPIPLNHLLIVSRSYLPINVSVPRRNAPPYPENQSNDALLEWLVPQLRDVKRTGRPTAKLGWSLWSWWLKIRHALLDSHIFVL